MRKLTATWLLSAALLAISGTAAAQTTTPTATDANKITLGKADFVAFKYQYQKADGSWVDMNKTTFQTYFNLGNCECDRPIRVIVSLVGGARTKIPAGKTGSVQLRGGEGSCVCQEGAANCTTPLNPPNCTILGATVPIASLANGAVTFSTSVKQLFLSGRAADSKACDRTGNLSLYIYLDGEDSGEYSDATDVTETLALDGVPPAPPTGLKVTGGNDALEVRWDKLDTVSDLQGYQALCARGNGAGGVMPVFNDEKKTRFGARYTASGTCALSSTTGALDGADAGTDAGAEATSDAFPTPPPSSVTGNAPQELADLNPLYVCSDLMTNQSSVRIEGLQNGIPYAVSIVAIDKLGNPSIVSEALLAQPVPTRDFYSGYRAAGGDSEGGCSVGGRGSAGAALGLAGLALLLVRRRKERHQ